MNEDIFKGTNGVQDFKRKQPEIIKDMDRKLDDILRIIKEMDSKLKMVEAEIRRDNQG